MKKKIERKTVGKYWNFINVFIVFLFIVYWFNRDIIIKSSVLDDYYVMKLYCTDFYNIIFNGYKFRPISSIAIAVISWIAKGDCYVYGICTLIIYAFCMSCFYILFLKMFNMKIVSFVATFAIAISHLSYYQITTQLGLMETISMFLGILTIYCMYTYVQNRQETFYYLAVLSCILTALSHERYVVLFPIVFLVGAYDIFYYGKKQINKDAINKILVAIVGFIICMLLLFFNTENILVGTQKEVVTIDSLKDSWFVFLKQYLSYVFMIHGTELHLSMVAWSEYPEYLKALIVFSIILVVLLVGSLIYVIGKIDREKKIRTIFSFGILLLSMGAIATVCSSTIRVELRWVFFSSILLFIIIMYIAKVLEETRKNGFGKVCAIIYFVIAITFSLFVRDYYPRLHYWSHYDIANNLYDETYAKYKDGIYEKEWIVMTSTGTHDSINLILDSYDIYDQYNLKLQVVHSWKQLKEIKIHENTEVLFQSGVEFINITRLYAFTAPLQTTLYEDNYMGEVCNVRVGIPTKYLCATLVVPEGMENHCKYYLNGIEAGSFNVYSGNNDIRIELKNASLVDFEFEKSYDFLMDGRALTCFVKDGFWIE